jgi:hypothetical protein
MNDFLDCLKGQLPNDLYKRAERAYEQNRKAFESEMGSEEAKVKATQRTTEFFDEYLKKQKNNLLTTAQRSLEMWDEVNRLKGNKTSDWAYANVILERIGDQQAYNRGLVAKVMNAFIEKYKPRLGVFRPAENISMTKQVYREMFLENTGDVDAHGFYKSYNDTQNYLIDQLNAHGASINKRAKRQPGQFHDSELLKSVSPEEWWSRIFPLLDRTAMIDKKTGAPLDDANLKRISLKIYDEITTGIGEGNLLRLSSGDPATVKPKSIVDRYSDKRFFVFKDADSFFAYNDMFGSGDEGLYNSMIDELGGMAEDLAVLQVMGPNPEDVHKYMMSRISFDPSKSKEWDLYREKQTEGAFKLLTGKDYAVGNPHWSINTYSTGRNLFTAAKLGSAALLALSDVIFAANTLKLNGMSATKGFIRYFGGLNPLKQSDRTLAANLALAGDIVTDGFIAASRYGEIEAIGKSKAVEFSQKTASATIHLSGLKTLTTHAKKITGLEFYGYFGAHIKAQTPWSELDRDLLEAFNRYNITQDDWAKTLQTGTLSLDEQGNTAFMNVTEWTDKELATKYGTFAAEMMRKATNEPSVMLRSARTAFGANKNSLKRMAATDAFFLKSFAISAAINHVIPAFSRAFRRGEFGSLGILVVGGTIIGTITSQLREVFNQKDMKPWDDWRTWAGGLISAGGLSIMADFLFGSYARNGQKISDLFGGWLGNTGLSIFDITTGAFGKTLDPEKEANWLRDFYTYAQNFIPAKNLWYSKAFTDRFIWDNVERAVDPEFDKKFIRDERKLKRQTGQGFWWPRTSTLPTREPVVTKGIPDVGG